MPPDRPKIDVSTAGARPLSGALPTAVTSSNAVNAEGREPFVPCSSAVQEAPISAPSFSDLYRAHVDFVWRTARRLRVPETSLDDVVQDVFIVVHRRLADYDGHTPMRGWLYGVTQRVVADHRRRARRKDAPLTGSETNEQGEERFASTAPPTSAGAEQAESVALLESLLARLAPEKAEVLILAHLEQLTVPEIAEGTGANINTVYSRLRTARRELDELVAAERQRRQP